MDSYEGMARLAASAAASKKGANTLVLSLKDITLIADYFVITSGNSTVQVQAIARHITETLELDGAKLLRQEGFGDARWILLDFGSVVVHIFHQEERRFYDLERLWGDAPVLDLIN